MRSLNLLHLTDLHLGMKDRGLWANSRDFFLRDLRQLTERLGEDHGPWDVVVLTGDLVFSGQPDQYEQLDKELASIWEILTDPFPSEPAPVLLAVPGNHDMRRPKRSSPVVAGLLDSSEARNGLWEGDEDTIDIIRGWFGAYSEWWERTKLKPSTGVCAGMLPGEFSYLLQKDGACFGFLGMNTAFLDLHDEVKEGSLHVDIRQANSAVDNDLPAWIRNSNIAFLLTHHPPSWLHPDAGIHFDAEIATSGRFAAHLCGHLHESFGEARRTLGGSERQMWQAVSLFGLRHLPDGKHDRKHGYAAVRVELDAGGAEATLWPRIAVPLQDQRWRLTADFSYHLDGDLLSVKEPSLASRTISDSRGPSPSMEPVAAMTPQDWNAAAESSPLWNRVDRADPWLGALRSATTEAVRACHETWRASEPEVSDPWRDATYALRVLDWLPRLMGSRLQLSSAEASLLIVAPFLSTGVWAAGYRWFLTSAEPTDLEDHDSSREPRITLEQVLRAREGLVQRADRLPPEERRVVCDWIVHRALSQTPLLWVWEASPACELWESIASASCTLRVHRILSRENLSLCGGAVGMSASALEGEGGAADLSVVEVEGQRIRLPSLSWLLSVAGWAALPLAAADEVIIDHVGRDREYAPSDLTSVLQAARWRRFAKGFSLVCETHHPVVDFATTELVRRADEVLTRAHVARETPPIVESGPYGLLMNLPSRLSSDGVVPGSARDGLPRFRRPHVRFRLDAGRMQDLLMGRKLYGDPILAVRELYQNALDACRYREARVNYLRQAGRWIDEPYSGHITLTQGVDSEGRTIIDCVDNGVGMTAHIVERVFSMAGRRFHDTRGFQEERARWKRAQPPIELYPNSQFGIGVLSYFMLADEIEIQTRRFLPDGSVAPALLLVRVSSATGLFRMTEVRQERGEATAEDMLVHGGTRVRLVLASTTVRGPDGKEKKVSCGDTLANLLVVADYHTTVEEAARGKEWEWPAKTPAPEGRPADSGSFLKAGDADVWWASSRTPQRVLADGIVTDATYPRMLVNLQGARYPKLSVDRRRVDFWDSTWPAEVAREGCSGLEDWDGLTFEFLWDLERQHPTAARQVFQALVARDAEMPVSHFSGKPIPVALVGCFAGDEFIFQQEKESKEPSLSFDSLPTDIVHAWRLLTWAAVGVVSVSGFCEGTRTRWSGDLLAEPGDASLLGEFSSNPPGASVMRTETGQHRTSEGGWTSQPICTPRKLLTQASEQDRTLDDLLGRAEVLKAAGVMFVVGPPVLSTSNLSSDDVVLLSQELDGRPPWAKDNVNGWQIVRASAKLQRRTDQIARRLRELAPLGLSVLDGMKPGQVPQIQADDMDLALLSRDLDGKAPWLEGNISEAHLLRAAINLSLSFSDAVRRVKRMIPLVGDQISGLDVDPERLRGLEIDELDLQLLSRDLNGVAPWLEGELRAGHVVQAAVKKSLSAYDVAARLERLIALLQNRDEPSDFESLRSVEVDDVDARLLSVDALSSTPIKWLPAGDIPAGHIAYCAHHLGMRAQEVMERLARFDALGVKCGANTEGLADLVIDATDVALLSRDLDGVPPWIDATPSGSAIARSATKLGWTGAQVVTRLQELAPLGLRLEIDLDRLRDIEIEDGDASLLTALEGHNCAEEPPWGLRILSAMSSGSTSPEKVTERISDLADAGLASIPEDVAVVASTFTPLPAGSRKALDRFSGGMLYDLWHSSQERAISPLDILCLSYDLEPMTPRDLTALLVALEQAGVNCDFDREAVGSASFSKEDLQVLPALTEHRHAPREMMMHFRHRRMTKHCFELDELHRVGAADVLRAADMLDRSPRDVVRSAHALDALGLRCEVSEGAIGGLKLDDEDRKLLSTDLEGYPPWVGTVTRLHLMRAAVTLHSSPQSVAKRLKEISEVDPSIQIPDSFIYLSLPPKGREVIGAWKRYREDGHALHESLPELVQAARASERSLRDAGTCAVEVGLLHEDALATLGRIPLRLPDKLALEAEYGILEAAIELSKAGLSAPTKETLVAAVGCRVWWVGIDRLSMLLDDMGPLVELAFRPRTENDDGERGFGSGHPGRLRWGWESGLS